MDLDTNGAEILRLFVAGEGPTELLYVALEDTAGNVAIATHAAPETLDPSAWQPWLIPYSDLSGINLDSVRTVYMGVGDRGSPSAGGTGIGFIDDIGFGKPVVVE
ncbi:MAG: hypothetical protein JSW27_13315 [Phycisphaerales bacterium]|nr:MAG: hypothetical protein JSW27_13315 [Phycisphaerales bacterium]